MQGFQEKSTESFEALSWTEYRQALSELCPAFHRHGMNPKTSGERTIAPAALVKTSRPRIGSGPLVGTSSSGDIATLVNQPCRDPWEDVVDRTASCTSPLRRCASVFESGGRSHHPGDALRDCPPRSPGADSYGVLRRKRHAAVALDYEAVTKQLPQVGSFRYFGQERYASSF